MKKIFVLIILLAFVSLGIAQEKFDEGVIITKMTMSSDNEQISSQLAAMGDMTTTVYMKGDKTRSEVSNPMTGDVVTVSDMGAKEMLMIMEMQKSYMVQSIDLSEEMLDKIKISEGTDTKEILGYDCKQYLVKIENSAMPIEMELFVTDKIQPIMTQQTMMLGNKIDGLVMLMTMNMNQMGSTMTISAEVTELKKEPVSDDLFSLTPPEGYTKM